jgi:hypothetical protein
VRVRVGDRDCVAEVVVFFRTRGFLVVERGSLELDLHPLNHVSARSDEILVSATLELFRSEFPAVLVAESV